MIYCLINGHPGVGKDEFVCQCMKLDTRIHNVSTVDFVKNIAKQCGWDGSKTPENRAFLSNLKDLLTQWNDVPYQQVLRDLTLYKARLDSYDIPTKDVVCFIHCREPQEIQKFVDRIGAYTLCIRRDIMDEQTQSNHADAETDNYQYDYYIDNNGTIEELKMKAAKFLDEIQKRVD